MLSRMIAVGGVILSLITALLWIRVNGLVALPRPTGSLLVGTTIRTLPTVGGDRDARPLAVQIWYPTTARSRPKARYAYGLRLSIRDRLLDATVRTNAILDGTVAPGPWPVLLYVPGVGGMRSANTSLSEELASHGYVVVAMNDEREWNGGTDTTSAAAVARTMRWGAERIHLQIGDVSRAIDALERMQRQRGGFLTGRLKMNRLGIFGFSLGGSVAAEAVLNERRIVAAVDLDGALFGRAMNGGVDRPFLILSSTPFPLSEEGIRAILGRPAFDRESYVAKNAAAAVEGMRRHGGYLVAVADAGHFNFTDAPLTPTIRHTGQGTLAALHGSRIVNSYVRSFFDGYLKGASVASIASIFATDPVVTFRRYDGPALRSTERFLRKADGRLSQRHP